MSSPTRLFSQIEPLEARIAPAAVINNPLPDIVAGVGKTGAFVDLSQLTAALSPSAYHTTVRFITNYDTDAATAGIQAGEIVIELYDDVAPLTVQNFLSYVNNANARGDYDGTLFHRAVPGFVLQGGGYEAATPKVHIPVSTPVHNEANIVNRPNVEGTVSMAKAGGDPNSATSEWFVNLADNSAGKPNDLDSQNGGFTVFGKVTAGSLALAKSITSLPLVNVGLGASTPAQGGRPISVVDAIVTPPTPASTAGLTYTIESVTPTAGSPADLFTSSLNGAQLTLSYGAGKSGTADVTVSVDDGTGPTTDTFTVDVRPNFAVKLTGDSLPRFLVPGDAGFLKFEVANSGAVAGAGTVNVYLAKQTVTKNSFGQILTFADANPAALIPLGTTGSLAFNLASGKTKTFPIPVKLSFDPFSNDEAIYRVVTEVVPADTALTVEERFTDDNKPAAVSAHDAVNKFGTLSDINFGTRANVVLKYTGKNTLGQSGIATWTMVGPGTGTVGFDAMHEDVSLAMQGTGLASTVTAAFSKPGTHIGLQSIQASNPLGAANLASVDVSGLIVLSSGIKTLNLGDLSGESLLLIGAILPDNAMKAAITLRNVTDFSIESAMPLASLSVASWKDTGGSIADAVTAPSLGTLRSAGDFEADVSLTDGVPTTSITVIGKLQNSTITTTAGIGTVTLGAMLDSKLLVGVSSIPTNVSDFSDPFAIQSFTILGGPAVPSGSLFSNSQVAAQTIGAIKVQRVATTSGSGDFGFIADVIRSYSRIGGPTKTNVLLPQTFDDLPGDYVVKVL